MAFAQTLLPSNWLKAHIEAIKSYYSRTIKYAISLTGCRKNLIEHSA
jgi:hypothetical protein